MSAMSRSSVSQFPRERMADMTADRFRFEKMSGMPPTSCYR